MASVYADSSEGALYAVPSEAAVAYFGLSTLFQTNFFRLFFRYCTGV